MVVVRNIFNMEIDLDVLSSSIMADPSSAAVSTLHRIVLSREIEDIENINIKSACEAMWISLMRCWFSKDYSEKEKVVWETVSWMLTLPSFVSSEEPLQRICSTVTMDFCSKLLNSLERGITEFEGHGAHLLRWIYLHVCALRRPLRAALGARLVKYGQSPDILKVININPLLRLIGDIISGTSLGHDRRQQQRAHRHLLASVLMPLHQPNQMVEWRDQIPVLQLYHESLVRCLVRLVEWGASGDSSNIDSGDQCCAEVVDMSSHQSNSSSSDVREEESPLHNCGLASLEEEEDEEESTRSSVSKARPTPPITRPLSQPVESSAGLDTLLVLMVRNLLESLWPEGFNTNTPKEILLLHEVEKLLEISTAEEFSSLLDVVLNRLKISLMHDNVRTIQRALQFFRNEQFMEHIRPHSAVVIQQLLPALYRKGRLFWNLTVNKMTAAVLKKLQEIDALRFAASAEEVAGPCPPGKRSLSAAEGVSLDVSPSLSRAHLKSGENSASLRGDSAAKHDAGRMRPPTTTTTTASRHSVGSTSASVLPPPSARPAPSGVVVPKGSMREQLLAASSGSGAVPVTITGVAPWAIQQQVPQNLSGHSQQRRVKMGVTSRPPARQPLSPSSSDTAAASTTAPSESMKMKRSQPTGLQLVRKYMKQCRISGRGGDPKSAEDYGTDEDEDSDDDEDAPSSWSVDQACAQPKLLPELRFHDLVFGRVLGEGSFGTVKYARQIIKGPSSLRSNWPEYAVKVLSQARLHALGRSSLQIACREIAALHSLSHPGVARLVSAFRYTDGCYLVLEYASQGDLHTYIIQQGRLSETHTRFVVGEICAALQSIHALGLAYNDLKPENVLITEVGHIKLADFGACRAVTTEGRTLLAQGNVLLRNLRDGDWKEQTPESSALWQASCEVDNDESSTRESSDYKNSVEPEVVEAEGTPGYLPPEILSHAAAPGWKSDSWALGCVLFFCLVGRPKYFGATFQEVLRQIAEESGDATNTSSSVHFDVSAGRDESEDVLSSLSSSTSQLLDELLQHEPSERISVKAVCSHPFFSAAVEEDYRDPQQYHMQAPVKLPRTSDVQNEHQGEDKAWARRQCSMVWSPMPQAYDFGSDSSAEGRGATGLSSSSARQIFLSLERKAICETDEERLSSWLP